MNDHESALSDILKTARAATAAVNPEEFEAKVLKLSPKAGDVVFVSMPGLSVEELKPIATSLSALLTARSVKHVITNQPIDVLDEGAMKQLGWIRKPEDDGMHVVPQEGD